MACRRASNHSRQNARVLKLLGGALYAAGDHTAAKSSLQDALSLQTNYPDAWCDLGESQLPEQGS